METMVRDMDTVHYPAQGRRQDRRPKIQLGSAGSRLYRSSLQVDNDLRVRRCAHLAPALHGHVADPCCKAAGAPH